MQSEITVNHSHDPLSPNTVNGVTLQLITYASKGRPVDIINTRLTFEETLHLAARLLRLVQGADSPHATPNERVGP